MGSIQGFLVSCIPVLAIIGASFLLFLLIAPYQLHQRQADEISRLTPPELNLFFETSIGSFGGRSLQYEPVTLTNRSERTMNLDFVAVIDYFNDNGQPRRIRVTVEWGSSDSAGYCATAPIELDGRKSKQGRIAIFLPEPAKNGIESWNLTPGKNIYIEASDSVTGTRIAFKPTPGHPKGKVSYPLPPVTEMLAAKASESTIPNPPA